MSKKKASFASLLAALGGGGKSRASGGVARSAEVNEAEVFKVFAEARPRGPRATLQQREAHERAVAKSRRRGNDSYDSSTKTRRGNRTKTLQIRATVEFLFRLKSYAKSSGLTVTEVVERAVEQYLDTHNEKKGGE